MAALSRSVLMLNLQRDGTQVCRPPERFDTDGFFQRFRHDPLAPDAYLSADDASHMALLPRITMGTDLGFNDLWCAAEEVEAQIKVLGLKENQATVKLVVKVAVEPPQPSPEMIDREVCYQITLPRPMGKKARWTEAESPQIHVNNIPLQMRQLPADLAATLEKNLSQGLVGSFTQAAKMDVTAKHGPCFREDRVSAIFTFQGNVPVACTSSGETF
ncbi:MAG: hypothetical protein EBZ48_13030, partial [Proteobacteria bacterium]|nr:hypothetical protein [Pseudomonadota bacterium]